MQGSIASWVVALVMVLAPGCRGDKPAAERGPAGVRAGDGAAEGTRGERARDGTGAAERSVGSENGIELPAAWLRSHAGHHLSPLAVPPDWSQLDRFHGTMTRDELIFLLDEVYTQNRAYRRFITVGERSASIRTAREDPERRYFLQLALAGTGNQPKKASGPGSRPAAAAGLALDKTTIAIDPGHIGGPFAQTEWRWFRIGESKPVAEGDMTLMVARLLADRLREHGARVELVRSDARPVAAIDPDRLAVIARRALVAQGKLHQGLSDAEKREAIRDESARLAYRSAEIRARALRVNGDIEPDLTVCLHFNAEPWDDPARPSLTDKNHAHLIVNGSYTADELLRDDVRFEMMHKLLSRVHRKELAISRQVARTLAEATGLPGESYPESESARPMSDDGYIWARNLLANRIYRGPVLYLEPYVLNNRDVFARVQKGDYPGRELVAGVRRRSIYREYADAVTRGIVAYYRSRAK